MAAGIVRYGTYVPYWRLARAAIGQALGSAGGRGERAVASFDEDTTSMGAEAARVALAGASAPPTDLFFATSEPAYLDKTNATAIHAACGLPASARAYDMVGAVRSGFGALRAALDAASAGRSALAVLSDIRTGLPDSADERDGGDAAAAFLTAPEGAATEVLAEASRSEEFLERWRLPGQTNSRIWEERFGLQAYLPLLTGAAHEALRGAGLEPAEVDHVVAASAHGRALRTALGELGVKPDAVGDDLSAAVGFTGSAHAGLLLAGALDRANPGETILLLLGADGADALVLRTTDALPDSKPTRALADGVGSGRNDLSYANFLTWRGMLRREPPRRPDPDAPSAPPSLRSEQWKFGFVGSRCEACGARHLPPQRVCVKCGAQDRMTSEPLADVRARVATYTVDRLAFSLAPPTIAAVIDFEGGGRFQCEMTDADPSHVQIGDEVEMTFRRLYSAGNGVHNYFWKCRPVRSAASAG